jgi:chromosomal replication initiator protein
MHRPLSKTFSSFVAVAECRAAQLAACRLDADLALEHDLPDFNPLYLFGPPGCGKSHLCQALIDSATRRQPQLTVAVIVAGDWRARHEADENDVPATPLGEAGAVDLLVLEDLQHLPARCGDTLANALDGWMAEGRRLVATAACGPQQLDLPARLVSRLAAGLVVPIEPLQPASRLRLLQEWTKQQRLSVAGSTLEWLARRISGGRQLEGSLARLDALARDKRQPLEVADVAEAFTDENTSSQQSVERIVASVSRFFNIDAGQLRSKQRRRSALLPRQIGMYLARKLTALPLKQIGAYFGGRDHATVLHACRKIEGTLTHDLVLRGNVRQLSASLA